MLYARTAMSKFDGIISTINANIGDLVKQKASGKCKFRCYGFVSPIKIKTERGATQFMPALINKDGECHYVFSDDDFDLGVYHRFLSQSFAKGEVWGREREVIETSEIQLIVWGFSPKLKMLDLDVSEQLIIPAIPADVDLVSVSFDKQSVVNGEFRNIDYDFKPEEFIFSVKYKVISKYRKACL